MGHDGDVLFFLLSCGADPPAEPVDCSGPTWTDFGAGFFRTWCQSCHSATTPDRAGAPEGLDYDTYEQVVAGAETIRDAVLVRGSMPLGGGVYDADLAQLEAFLDCPSVGDGAGAELESPDPVATLSAEDVVAVVDRALPADGVPNPYDARDRLLEWLLFAQPPGCPSALGFNTNAPWEGCTTTDGYTFSGLSEGQMDIPHDNYSAMTLMGDFRWTDPDGNLFLAGGEANLDRDDDHVAWELTGTWADATAEGWIQDFGGALDGTFTREQGQLVGSLGHGDANLLLDVTFDADCTDGVVHVREDAGWHRLDLTCGCGPWTFEDQDLGEICLDLSDRLAPTVEALAL